MTRSDDELRGVSKHLYYEFEMLSELTHKMVPGGWPERVPQWQHNAHLESFAIHARALVQFFYDGRTGGYPESASRRGARRYRNAYADDFFDDATWKRSRPKPKPEALRTVDSRVAQEIAHLTYNRATVAEEAKSWRYGTIFLDVARTVHAFLRVVPRAHVVDTFLEDAWQLLPETVRQVSPRPSDQIYSVDALRSASAATAGARSPAGG
jgi:hypothetical protein